MAQEELLLNLLATLSNVSFDEGSGESALLLLQGSSERLVRVCLEVLMEQGNQETVLESLRVLCNVSRSSPSARRSLRAAHGQECLVLLVAHHQSGEVGEFASRVLVNVGLSQELYRLLQRHVP